MANETVNGAPPQAPSGQQMRVQVSGPQMLAATGFLMDAQINALIGAGTPPEMVIDLLLNMTTTLVARVDQPMIRQAITSKIAGQFEDIVRQKEIQVRTTAGGVIVPNGTPAAGSTH